MKREGDAWVWDVDRRPEPPDAAAHWLADEHRWLGTAEQDQRQRGRRTALLAQSDVRVVRAAELGQALAPQWRAWRQALRDLPAHPAWPWLAEADWPAPPEPTV